MSFPMCNAREYPKTAVINNQFQRNSTVVQILIQMRVYLVVIGDA